MTETTTSFFLGIGSVFSETVTSRLSTTGGNYVSKMLQSRPQNWRKIAELLAEENLTGVVVKLTGADYQSFLSPDYQEVTDPLLSAIGRVPHLVLAHDAVAGPPLAVPLDEETNEEWEEWLISHGENWNDRIARAHFGDMDPEVQARVNGLMERHGILVTTYKRNAEASILASDFIGDLHDHLIFRLYVPTGRIYEDEISRLLSLFHHWLGAVKGATVRQGGYQTAHGRVIEFFGDQAKSGASVTTELAEFNEFLGLLDDPAAASAMLVGLGVDPGRVDELVSRYSRDARRVLLDARHERDRKMLALHQGLETELSEENLPVTSHSLTQLVQALVPVPSLSIGHHALAGRPHETALTLNMQVIQKVEGVVAQTVYGDVVYGTPADELLKLIRASTDPQRLALEDATKQLADPGAPTTARVSARQRLKAFLLRNASRIEASTYDAVWEWLSNQITGG